VSAGSKRIRVALLLLLLLLLSAMALRWREERDGMASRPSRRRERGGGGRRKGGEREREREMRPHLRGGMKRGQPATDGQRRSAHTTRPDHQTSDTLSSCLLITPFLLTQKQYSSISIQ
jgi:hypothetical protein